MKKTLQALIMFSVLATNVAVADDWSQCRLNQDLSTDVGYVMLPSRLAILQKDLILTKTTQIPNKNLIERIQNFIERYNSKADKNLAEEIIRVSRAVGVDPLMFASLIMAESTFNPKAISHTGALGLTQMTQIAFEELRDQFDVGDPKFKSKSVDTLKKMSLDYLQTETEVKKFIQFIASTKNPKNNRLVLSHKRFSLLSGAMLFKIKLALSNGNYRTALRKYNGSKDQVPYANKILTAQNNLVKVNLDCSIDPKAEAIIELTCALSEDTEFCESYLGQLQV